MSNLAKILLLLPLLASVGHGAPVSTELDTTFDKFFRIKDLIDNINIKHFRALQGRKADGVPAIEGASTSTDADVLTEIDLTEEAISNDQVAKLCRCQT